jgi:hypothetical protein
MRSSVIVLAALWLGCSSTSSAADAPADNAGLDSPVTDAPVTDTPVTDTPVTDAPVTDAPVTDAPAADAPRTCPLPPIDTAVCTRDEDCATATRGCFCGQQPVIGVNVTNRDAVQRCEAEAMRTCALGCPVAAGQVAEDGQSVTDGGAVAVRCEVRDGGATGACRTYVPR